MKKLIILMILLVGLLASCSQEKYLAYEHEYYAISFPPEWRIATLEGGIVGFVSPKISESDVFSENLNVLVAAAQPEATTDDYADAGIEQLKQAIPEFALVSRESTSLSGNPALRLAYRGSSEGLTLKFVQVLTIKDGVFYTLTFVGEEKEFNNYSGNLEKMLESFRMK